MSKNRRRRNSRRSRIRFESCSRGVHRSVAVSVCVSVTWRFAVDRTDRRLFLDRNRHFSRAKRLALVPGRIIQCIPTGRSHVRQLILATVHLRLLLRISVVVSNRIALDHSQSSPPVAHPHTDVHRRLDHAGVRHFTDPLVASQCGVACWACMDGGDGAMEHPNIVFYTFS